MSKTLQYSCRRYTGLLVKTGDTVIDPAGNTYKVAYTEGTWIYPMTVGRVRFNWYDIQLEAECSEWESYQTVLKLQADPLLQGHKQSLTMIH